MPRAFIYIKANTIDSVAAEILGALEDTTKGNVMHFYGWYGLGASAALKVVAKRLKSSAARTTDDPKSKLFDKVIHLDCSVWKSRRALQKVVAEELELPQSVMDMFDQHDEDDDFNGVDQGSREEIKEVTWKIFTNLGGHRVVVVFHNGSKSYIDLNSFGISVHANLPNKVLWTDCGRFCPGEYEMPFYWSDELMGSANALIYGSPLNMVGMDESMLWDLVHEEAKEVAEYMGMPDFIDHMIVEECILYMWSLQAMGGVDWETHASNYWVCNGIIQGDRSVWEIGDALQSYIHLNMNWEYMDRAVPFSTTHLRRDVLRQPLIFQSSSSSKITSVPPEATSFFMEGDDKADAILPVGMFQHLDNSKLHVLHLSFCTFSFAFPPFLCCRNLRFLLLHRCKDDTSITEEKDQSHSQSGSWKACFGKLWVLDLNYTELYRLLSEKMINVMADLRELNVKGLEQWHITDLRGNGTSLVKLRVTSDHVPAGDDDTNYPAPFPNLSRANNLKTIILDGCVGLEQVNHDALPPSLESFSFLNNVVDAAKISSISFRGCSKLKSILLRGCLGRLEELDLSGTAVKTLDLREVEAPNLKRLILLGCEKFRAMLWPPEDKMMKILKVVRIDTNRSASISGQANWEEKTKEASFAAVSSSIAVVAAAAATRPGISQAASFDFNWYISIRDARLLRSLVDVHEQCYNRVHMEIDSSPVSRVAIGSSEVARGTRSLQQPNKYLDIRYVVFGGRLQVGVISWMWDFPPSPAPVAEDWYVHIQDEDEMKIGLLQQHPASMEGTSTSVALLPPNFICDYARTLHVHDSLSITTIDSFPRDTIWGSLQWCRVERCPKLHTVFRTPQRSNDPQKIFESLETFWASHLPAACYIWNWSSTFELGSYSFQRLRLLHLDYCPRVIHVLPLYMYWNPLLCLETLEIVCCGDLREVFPLHPERPRHPNAIEFPRLRRIHLHELPALQRICGCRMSAPKLKTVKIRGCWSLKRLPAISGSTKPPKVDCEKEWWDSLEWDGVESNHHPSLYKVSHSVYYKQAQLPRGTLLRCDIYVWALSRSPPSIGNLP